MTTPSDKAVELMDRAANAVETFAVKIEALATKMAPEAWDVALGVAQVSALQNLMLSGMWVLIGALIGVFTWRLGTKAIGFDPDYPLFPAASIWFFGGVLAIIGAIKGCIGLFSAWNWVGVFNPELYLAREVLGL